MSRSWRGWSAENPAGVAAAPDARCGAHAYRWKVRVMTQLFRNHAHWGTFLAEVRDGRVVGVRPFERDPDPSPLLDAIPASVHAATRIDRPMVRQGWLAHGPGHGEGRGGGAVGARS